MTSGIPVEPPREPQDPVGEDPIPPMDIEREAAPEQMSEEHNEREALPEQQMSEEHNEMMSGIPVEASGDEFIRGQMEYWKSVRESGGFDLEGISEPQGTIGLMTYVCDRKDVRYPYPVLVNLYARFGLLRYNVSHGTDLEFHHLKKFNKTMNFQSVYYITLAAYDPHTTSLVTLQVGVAEGRRREKCRLNLSCFIARLQGTSTEPVQLCNFPAVDAQLPHWPSNFDDTLRFLMEDDSSPRLQKHDWWLRLYLELAVSAEDREIEDSDLSQLHIVSVAVETIERNEAHEPVVSDLYITFKGLDMACVGDRGKHVERRVILRANSDERTGCWTIHGGYGFSFGEVVERRYISRPSFGSLYETGKFIPCQGPMRGPPLWGIIATKARELGLYRED